MTISAVAQSIVGASTTSNDLASLSGNESTFLQLLTTQLQNQDPLSPTDTNTFTQQLVEYSQVEQQIQTNQKLDTLNTLEVSNQVQNALSMVGADVEYGGSSFSYTEGNDATIQYNLASTAANNTITILNSSGDVVYTTAGSLTSGSNSFTWDGTTTEGTEAPTGTYTVNISAQDSSGTAITATPSVWGEVTGINADSTAIMLMLQGGGSVQYNNVSDVAPGGQYTNQQSNTSS